ncbi:MAG: cytochrome c [Gemmatimonadota bacterium]|jgi:mono/diheme cytochrome c family protein
MRAEARKGLAAVVMLATVTLGGCTKIENAMASVDFLNFLRESPAFDPYEAPRPAPENSVPVASPGERWEPEVEATEASLTSWGGSLANPLPMSDAVLQRGAWVYQTNCAVCHGVTGVGNGPIVGPGKLPFATNLMLQTTVDRADGYIYAIVRLGRGLMPSYRRIRPQDRWAVVNYVRHLQQTGEPIAVELPGTVQPTMDALNTTAPDAGATNGGQE